jgi:hypothetical protein
MPDNYIDIPDIILLEDYQGDYGKYIKAVYDVFQRDFIQEKTRFRGELLCLKWEPIFQNKASTFYHMTHEGSDEQNRTPDLRRCERMPWAKPTIENCDSWGLKIWTQIRQGKGGTKHRLCLWLEFKDEPDYIVILEIHKAYKLLWTAFVLQYPHEKRKRLKEYEEWVKTQKSPRNT